MSPSNFKLLILLKIFLLAEFCENQMGGDMGGGRFGGDAGGGKFSGGDGSGGGKALSGEGSGG